MRGLSNSPSKQTSMNGSRWLLPRFVNNGYGFGELNRLVTVNIDDHIVNNRR